MALHSKVFTPAVSLLQICNRHLQNLAVPQLVDDFYRSPLIIFHPWSEVYDCCRQCASVEGLSSYWHFLGRPADSAASIHIIIENMHGCNDILFSNNGMMSAFPVWRDAGIETLSIWIVACSEIWKVAAISFLSHPSLPHPPFSSPSLSSLSDHGDKSHNVLNQLSGQTVPCSCLSTANG